MPNPEKNYRRLYGLCALLLAAALTLAPVMDYRAACEELRGDVIRLHILADSDAPAAQEIKLQVRDALLARAGTLLAGGNTAEEALCLLEKNLPAIAETANETLRSRGCAYTAKAELTEEYFSTRAYGDLTLPAGKYAALRVTLGGGEGQNWWCVMFPPLCLPAAEGEPAAVDAFSENEKRVLSPAGYEIRFWLVDKIEELLQKRRK